MCSLMFRQLWLARERFRETSQGSAGSWHVSWNTGHSNSCFIRFTCTNDAKGILTVSSAIRRAPG
jgi:hypothetical protein